MTDIAPINTVHFWRPAELPGVEILHENNATRLHSLYFSDYTISTAVHVATEVRYRHQSYMITSGSVHLGEPGEVYTATRQYQPCSVQVIQMDPARVQKTAYELGLVGQPHFRLPITWETDLYVALLQFHQALVCDSSSLEQQTRFNEILQLLLLRYTEHRLSQMLPHVGKPALYQARDYLHAYWNTNITLDTLAQTVHHSKSHLADSFRREFGIPPHTYQAHLRIARARVLLAQGHTISDVANQVGFADQAHLTRYFKRILGITPAVYAQNRKIVQDNGTHTL